MTEIDHPSHYNQGKIEVIDVIEDWDLNFNLGNCIKYIARAKHKGNLLEDYQKALWYLSREVKNLETKMNDDNERLRLLTELRKSTEQIALENIKESRRN